MWSYFKQRRMAFYLVAMFVANFLWENLGKPIWGINIENWAASRGLDDELLDGGRDTMSLIDSTFYYLIKMANFASHYLASDWFFGFVCGSVLFAFWDPVSAAITRRKDETPPNPSLKPVNGLHPAIFEAAYQCGEGVTPRSNYGVERWSVLPVDRGAKLWVSLYFERQTGIERIEVCDLNGKPIVYKREHADNRLLVIQVSGRILREGIRVRCYNVRDSRDIARGVFQRPQLLQDIEEKKQP